MGNESDVAAIYNWCTRKSPKMLSQGTENQRANRNYTNNNITKTGQNSEKSPGNFKKLAVIQTPVKDY